MASSSAEKNSFWSTLRPSDRILVGVSALGIAILLVQLLMFGHGRDQGIYTVVARSVVEGKMPYRDAWDFKPPGIFLVYAFARLFFGNAQWGIRVVEALGLVLTSFGLVTLTRRFWGDGRIGVIASVIMVLVHTQLDFWHTAQPESFGGMLTIVALLCLPAPPSEGSLYPARWHSWFSAGAIFGFTFLLKPPLVGGIAAIVLLPAWYAYAAKADAPLVERLESAVRNAIKPALWTGLGTACPILLCLLWFMAKGALRDLYQVLFVFTPHYTALGWQGATVTGMTYFAFTEWLQQYGSVPTVGILLALAFGAKPKETPLLVVLVSILGVQLVGVAMQGKFFPYHYGACWPLTGMIAALGYRGLWEKMRSYGRGGIAVFYALVVLIMLCRTATKDTVDSFLVRTKKRLTILAGGFSDQKTLDTLASVADIDTGAIRSVALKLRDTVPPNRSIFLWGFEPAMYDIAERRSASRYIYDVAQRVTWAKEEHRNVLMQDLRKDPPAAIVLEHWDVIPMVTGDGIDSADTLRDFHELRTFLEEHYALESKGGKFDIYRERQ